MAERAFRWLRHAGRVLAPVVILVVVIVAAIFVTPLRGSLRELFTVYRDVPRVQFTTGAETAATPEERAASLVPQGQLLIPVEGISASQLRDTFNEARADEMRRHDAIDIAAPLGTPVRAAAGGRIEKLGLSKDGGNTIYLRLPDARTIHYYAHLDAYAPGLVEGQTVRAGDRLGTVGFSGNASPTAPHLHFAVLVTEPGAAWYQQAVAINPYPLLVDANAP